MLACSTVQLKMCAVKFSHIVIAYLSGLSNYKNYGLAQQEILFNLTIILFRCKIKLFKLFIQPTNRRDSP